MSNRMEPVLLAKAPDSGDNTEDNVCKSRALLSEVPAEILYPDKSSSGIKSQLTINNPPVIGCLVLNDNKAGMEGLDREKINKVINEASKGSKFYENERKKEEILNAKIKEQQTLVESISASHLQFGYYQADQLLRELEETRDLSRTIVHVDMDAFYAAVEMRDDPSLKNKPMAVGSMSMLSTSNYMARRFGIRAAMPGFIGKKLCPELVIIPINFEKYIAVSDDVRKIMALYDPNFVAASLDEAYLDFTEHINARITSPSSSRTFLLRTDTTRNSSMCTCDLNLVLRDHVLQDDYQNHSQSVGETKTSASLINLTSLESDELKTCSICQKLFPPFTVKVYGVSAEEAVLEMRNRIEQRTQLTASAGIAPNTMLAKVCSDKNKPNGQFKVGSTKQIVEQFIAGLSVRKIPGIGKVTEKLLEALGVLTCSDLYKQRGLLYHIFSSKTFNHFMDIALGIGSSTVERDGERKSMSTEQTFGDLVHPEELYAKCQELCQYLARDLKREKLLGKSVTLKIKTVNFEVKTRTSTITNYSNDERVIFEAAKNLLKTEISAQQPDNLRLRLMGVRMSKLLSQADCSASVASYFDKHCNKNVAMNESVPHCLSPMKYKCQDGLTNSESRNSTLQPSLTIPQCFSLLNNDNKFKYHVKSPEKNVKSISPMLPNIKTEMTTNNKLLFCMRNNGDHRQGTDADFLFDEDDDYQMVERGDNKSIDKFVIRKPSQSCDALTNEKVNQNKFVIRKPSQSCDTLTNEKVNQNKFVIKTATVAGNPHGYTSSLDSCISPNFQATWSDTADGQQQTPSPAAIRIQKPPSTSIGSAQPTNADLSTDMIQCPVCGQQKYQWPLDQLNAHVDLCLSRSTVRDILQDQQSQHLHSSVSKKRSRQDDDTNHKHSRNQRTLLSFFKQ